MLKYLQIDQRFDAQQMKAEAALLQGHWWKNHYNSSHYEGEWNVLPLRSINGSVENIVAVHHTASSVNQYSNTPLLAHCPYINSVLDFFNCEKTAVRLMRLGASAVIKEHSDQEMSFEEGEVRLHIPVTTNDGVEFFLEDERIVMQEGECWYLNLSLNHRANNGGATDRIHLVMDCKVNDWMKALFSECFIIQKEAEEKKEAIYHAQDKQKIIEELRLMNTPTSLALADRLEKEGL